MPCRPSPPPAPLPPPDTAAVRLQSSTGSKVPLGSVLSLTAAVSGSAWDETDGGGGVQLGVHRGRGRRGLRHGPGQCPSGSHPSGLPPPRHLLLPGESPRSMESDPSPCPTCHDAPARSRLTLRCAFAWRLPPGDGPAGRRAVMASDHSHDRQPTSSRLHPCRVLRASVRLPGPPGRPLPAAAPEGVHPGPQLPQTPLCPKQLRPADWL